MRFSTLIGVLLITGALGCGKKSGGNGTGDAKPAEVASPGPVAPAVPWAAPSKQEAPGKQPTPPPTEPDPWPALPTVPAKPASHPNTAGGRVAQALDYAADHLMTAPKPPDGQLVDDWIVANAFKDIATGLIPVYPRRVLAKQPGPDLWGPAGDASADRDRIDAAFARVFAGWTHHRERVRRWDVEAREATLAAREPGQSPRQRRAAAEGWFPPGREVRVGSTQLGRLSTQRNDWVVLDASGDTGSLNMPSSKSAASVGGQLNFRKTFELHTGPATVALGGRVGAELQLIANAPLLIDLVNVNTPLVNVRTNGDALVRVGPGVGTLRLTVHPQRRALVLARGAPNLRVELVETRNAAVVNY